MSKRTSTTQKIEALMNEGITVMVQAATKRAEAGKIDHREFAMIIRCAMRWENLKRQLGIHAPESGAAIDALRQRVRKAIPEH
jgi:hypothetical protein